MTWKILTGDVREMLPTISPKSVQCVVTSPPYFGLRDYGVAGQIGLEPTLAEYIATMVDVFRLVRETLADDGVVFLNVGDSYAGGGGFAPNAPSNEWSRAGQRGRQGALKSGGIRPQGLVKTKDLMMVPARLAIALQDDGWYLRSDIIWHKPNPMPESVTDRPTSAHEHIFLLTKSARYFYDADAIREPLSRASVSRLAQDVDAQEGSYRANGGAKTNGTMKAVSRLTGGPRTNPDRPRSKGVEGRQASWHGDFANRTNPHRRETAVSSRDNFRRENSKRGIAQFGQSTGTHRPDRADSLVNEIGANARNVWSIATAPFRDAHFATFPTEIPRRCILAGSRECDTVLDPFAGSGTTLLVADRLGRNAIGIELNPTYAEMARKRIIDDAPLLMAVAD